MRLIAVVVLLLVPQLALAQSAPELGSSLLQLVLGFGLVLAMLFGCVWLFPKGPGTSLLLGWGGVGVSLRWDAVSVPMFTLVSFIGWVVLRYAAAYLDGEARQGAFVGWLCATLAAVLMLVLAGNIIQLVGAWIATSLLLHKLLLFHPERVAAQRAARKKFITARIGDAALMVAATLLIAAYGTTDLARMDQLARVGEGGLPVVVAAAALAVAALLKSAQFPTHGWLTEVMETPTPVSALLHAGVINAGGFLLIRFADVMLLAPGALAALAMIGGFTALFGGLVMLTQPAVKTSLAWSTVAQMGFMILECGLALFPLALLHILAHSLYMAHAFLASGGAVEHVAALRRPGPVAIPGSGAVLRAFLLAIVVFPSGLRTGHQLPRLVEQALVEAPLSTLASLAKVDPGELENRLSARGMTATPEQSIRQIARQNDVNERRLLSIVFMNH